jgi:glycerol-3-phosphate dehydrogenase
MVAPSQGVHLVVDRDFLPGDHALLVPKTADGRVLFAVPWLGKTILGTTDTPRRDLPLEPEPFADEVEFILRESAKLPGAARRSAPTCARSGSACARWCGPAARTAPTPRRSVARAHGAVGRSGLVTVTGGKWTTYRAMAEDVLARCPCSCAWSARRRVPACR